MSDFVGRKIICNSRISVFETYLPGCKDYLEIGTLFGGSAVLAGSLVKGNVYCVDPLDGYYRTGEPDPICGLIPSEEILMINWDSAGLDLERLFLYKVKTPPLPAGIPDMVDVAYIDGDHSLEGCRSDWELLRDRVNKFIIFDDIDKPEVRHIFQVAGESIHSGWEVAEFNSIVGVVRRSDGRP